MIIKNFGKYFIIIEIIFIIIEISYFQSRDSKGRMHCRAHYRQIRGTDRTMKPTMVLGQYMKTIMV